MTTQAINVCEKMSCREAVGNLLVSLLSSFPESSITSDVAKLGKVAYKVSLETAIANLTGSQSIHFIEDVSNYGLLKVNHHTVGMKVVGLNQKVLSQALRMTTTDYLSILLNHPTEDESTLVKILAKYLTYLEEVKNFREITYIYQLLNQTSLTLVNQLFEVPKEGKIKIRHQKIRIEKEWLK